MITAFVILIVAWLISLILGITKISSFIRNSEMCVLVCKKKKNKRLLNVRKDFSLLFRKNRRVINKNVICCDSL